MTGIGIDYSNVCRDYNTAYLDRDNTDPATSACMQTILTWAHALLADLLETFALNLYPLGAATPVTAAEVASKRFLFFSLEKGITLQSFVAQKSAAPCATPHEWAAQDGDGVLIQNDEDGEGIYLFVKADSALHRWLTARMKGFSLDDVAIA